jgi:hypothetical protein
MVWVRRNRVTTHADLRRRLGLGILGNVGVTGISFGGVLAGRISACFASASRTNLFVISPDSDVFEAWL